MFDVLENRRLLAASIINNVLTIPGTAGSDVISLSVDAQTQEAVVVINGVTKRFTLNPAAFNQILVDCQAGNDRVTFSAAVTGTSTINGGDGRDTLAAGSGDDTINGGAGNDTIKGYLGNDVIDGGTGADTMVGGSGNDTVTYASRTAAVKVVLDQVANDGETNEKDLIDFTVDTIVGGSGNDQITFGGPAIRVLNGGAGNDTLIAGDLNDTINGDDGNDALYGGFSDDVVNGGAGNDRIVGNPGADSLNGGADSDTLIGSAGPDTMSGGDGRDVVDYFYETRNVNITLDGVANDGVGKSEKDNILVDIENANGGAGNDRISGSTAKNFMHGRAGNDSLFGGKGADTLLGDDGDDYLEGGPQIDSMDGGAGNDTLSAQDGEADKVVGGLGVDVATLVDSVDVVTTVP